MSAEETALQRLLDEDVAAGNLGAGALSTTNALMDEPATNGLTRVLRAQEQLISVKQNLTNIIDSLASNPSFISRTADSFGKMSTVEKFGLGAVLTVPALVGLAVSINALAIGGALVLVSGGTTGAILQDHFDCSAIKTDSIKNGILSIANILELVIWDLGQIHEQLAEEINKFKKQNARLESNVSQLTEDVDTLTQQITACFDTEEALNKEKERLELLLKETKADTEEKAKLLQKAQEELTAVADDQKINQERLVSEVEALKTTRQEMDAKLIQARKTSEMLQKIVDDYAVSMKTRSQEGVELQQKLQTFCSVGDQSVARFVRTIDAAQERLDSTNNGFIESNARYQTLLAQQEELVERLAKIDAKLHSRKTGQSPLVANTMFAGAMGGCGPKIAENHRTHVLA